MGNDCLSRWKGNRIVIFNIADQFFAIGDICTHDDGPLGDGDLEGYNIVCPRHGGEFDVRTGKAVQLPVVVDIPAYPVKVVDGMISGGNSEGINKRSGNGGNEIETVSLVWNTSVLYCDPDRRLSHSKLFSRSTGHQ